MKPDEHSDRVTEDDVRKLDVDLNRVWHGISGELWAPPSRAMERHAARLLRSPALARALSITPSLLLSWVLASIAVFILGALVASAINEPIVPLLAPAVAGVAVSFAYGAGTDPAYEIARTMPTSARMILLLRVGVVFVTNAALGVLASLIVPSLTGITLLWLLPMMAISMLALAVAVVMRNATAGGAAAIAVWGAIVVGSELRNDQVSQAVAPATLGQLAPVYVMLTMISLGVTLWMSGDGSNRRELARWW